MKTLPALLLLSFLAVGCSKEFFCPPEPLPVSGIDSPEFSAASRRCNRVVSRTGLDSLAVFSHPWKHVADYDHNVSGWIIPQDSWIYLLFTPSSFSGYAVSVIGDEFLCLCSGHVTRIYSAGGDIDTSTVTVLDTTDQTCDPDFGLPPDGGNVASPGDNEGDSDGDDVNSSGGEDEE